MQRAIGWAAAAALVLGAATAAQGQSLLPRPVTPAGKAASAGAAAVPKTDDEVEAWIKANLDTKGWIYVGHDDRAVSLVPEKADAGPVFDLTVRFEYFDPEKAGDPLSLKDVAEIDCLGQRRRLVMVALYAEHGFKGRSQEEPIHEDWKPLNPDNFLDSHALDLCADAAATPAYSPVEGPKSLAEADVQAWIARTLKPGADAYVFYDDDGVNYVHGPVSRAAGGGYLMSVRQEWFEPLGQAHLHSGLTRLELDCQGRRTRRMDVTAFADHNLSGASNSGPYDDQSWQPPHDGLEALQLDRLCAAAKAGAAAP